MNIQKLGRKKGKKAVTKIGIENSQIKNLTRTYKKQVILHELLT